MLRAKSGGSRSGAGRPGRRGRFRRGPEGVTLAVALAGFLSAPAAPAALAAQERDERCRCVDRSGEELEDCVCLRTPSVRTFVWSDALRGRARLGVSVDTRQRPEDDRRGARITRVMEGSPADDAGLREGDIVVRIDGRSVFDALEDGDAEARIDPDRSLPTQRFLALARALEPEEAVEVEYLRDGRTERAVVIPEENGLFRMRSWVSGDDEGHVWSFDGGRLRERMEELRMETEELAERAREDAVVAWRLGPDGGGRLHFELPSVGEEGTFVLSGGDPCFSGGTGWGALVGGCVDGVELLELNPGLGAYFGRDEGVLVSEVREESTLGLEAGDVILAIGAREVETPAQARRILRTYEADETITFRVLRRHEEIQVEGRRR